MFIVLEGMDGSGKSTHISYIKNYLTAKNVDYVATFEPGGTSTGTSLRQIILHQKMQTLTEFLLLYAARHEHIATVIKPALAANKVVLCDRFFYSTFAYQVYAQNLDINLAEKIHSLIIDVTPDILIFLNVPPEVAQQRCVNRVISTTQNMDKFENRGFEFYKKVYNGYQQYLNKFNTTKIYNIDATQKIEDIQIEIKNIIDNLKF